MGDIFSKCRLWAVFYLKLRRASAAQRVAWKWKCDAMIALRKMNRSIRKLESLREITESEGNSLLKQWKSIQDKNKVEIDEALSELEEAQDVISRYDHAEESLNQELKICKEITIPDLVLQGNLTRQQLESDIAVLVRRQTPPPREEV